MAAKTHIEFLTDFSIANGRLPSGKETWEAATEATEEKFTAGRTLEGVAPTTSAMVPCHSHKPGWWCDTAKRKCDTVACMVDVARHQ